MLYIGKTVILKSLLWKLLTLKNKNVFTGFALQSDNTGTTNNSSKENRNKVSTELFLRRVWL